MKSEQEVLFNNFIFLKHNIQQLSAIIQNDITEFPLTEDDIAKWKRSMTSFLKEFYTIEHEIIKFIERNNSIE